MCVKGNSIFTKNIFFGILSLPKLFWTDVLEANEAVHHPQSVVDHRLGTMDDDDVDAAAAADDDG